MTEKKLFTCDICHTDYAKKEDAVNCEKEHCKIGKIADMRCTPHMKYPHKISVEFSDGTRRWYKA